MELVGVLVDVSGDGGYVYIKGERRLKNMFRLRPAIRWWAEQMEKELRKNEYKGGWRDGKTLFYLGRARANLREIKMGGFEQDSGDDFVRKCLADCSNFCMMVADNLCGINREYKKDK